MLCDPWFLILESHIWVIRLLFQIYRFALAETVFHQSAQLRILGVSEGDVLSQMEPAISVYLEVRQWFALWERMRIGVCLCLKTFGSKCWLEFLLRWGCRMSSEVAWILWPDLLDVQGCDVICSIIYCRTGPTASRFILWKLEYAEFHAMKPWVLLCKQAKLLTVLPSRATVLRTVEWATQLPTCSG